MKKAFTLLELLIIIIIILSLGSLVIGFYGADPNDEDRYSLNPDQEAAINSRKTLNRVEEQNELLRKNNELLEKQIQLNLPAENGR